MARGRKAGTTKQKGRGRFTHQKAPSGRARRHMNAAKHGSQNGSPLRT